MIKRANVRWKRERMLRQEDDESTAMWILFDLRGHSYLLDTIRMKYTG